jgi:hypothetical protein
MNRIHREPPHVLLQLCKNRLPCCSSPQSSHPQIATPRPRDGRPPETLQPCSHAVWIQAEWPLGSGNISSAECTLMALLLLLLLPARGARVPHMWLAIPACWPGAPHVPLLDGPRTRAPETASGLPARRGQALNRRPHAPDSALQTAASASQTPGLKTTSCIRGHAASAHPSLPPSPRSGESSRFRTGQTLHLPFQAAPKPSSLLALGRVQGSVSGFARSAHGVASSAAKGQRGTSRSTHLPDGCRSHVSDDAPPLRQLRHRVPPHDAPAAPMVIADGQRSPPNARVCSFGRRRTSPSQSLCPIEQRHLRVSCDGGDRTQTRLAESMLLSPYSGINGGSSDPDVAHAVANSMSEQYLACRRNV